MESIKKLRVSKNMTQKELSEKSGISRATIIAIEKNGPCYLGVLEDALATALACSVEDLYGDHLAYRYLRLTPNTRKACESIIKFIKEANPWLC